MRRWLPTSAPRPRRAGWRRPMTWPDWWPSSALPTPGGCMARHCSPTAGCRWFCREDDLQLLEDKVAVVTGASRGIGRAVARELAAAGAEVFVNYRSAESEASAVVAEIAAAGGRATAVQGDVSRETD